MEQNSINLTDTISNSLNSLFSQMFSSIDNSIYTLLDNIIFINPSIISNNKFRNLIGTSSSEGLLLICNSLILGFIIYYAINYLISHLTYSKIDSPKQFIFKAIIFIAFMNSSHWFCEQIINIVSIITNCILSIGETLFHTKISFSSFIDNINQNIYITSSEFNMFSFTGIIKSFTTFGFINLIFTYSLRYIMIQIFVLISPFAILSLITNSTEWFFKVWLKSFISLLLIQILISLILLLSCTININQNDNLSNLFFIGIIYALLKSNSYIKELFGGITTTINTTLSNFSLN